MEMTAENELNVTRVSKLRIQLRQMRFGGEEAGELKSEDGLATLRKRLKDRLLG